VLQPGEGALAGKAPKLSAEATEAIRTLQRALDESSVNLDNLTPAALQKAIRSLGQPVERKLLNLLDRGGAVALSEVQNDVTAALARIVRGPVARSLPDGLKELAAETLAHVEARQALNALAVADGQLLLQVALRGPGGWELADILVEEEGRREGDDGSDKALHLTLQLHPDALGPLRALVRLRREEVACSLVCSNPEVAEFIGDRLPEFQTGLAKQGFQVRSLQAVAVSSPAEAFGPLRPSRLRPRSLLDALL
jgi:flagellar hook-length control protein FliK